MNKLACILILIFFSIVSLSESKLDTLEDCYTQVRNGILSESTKNIVSEEFGREFSLAAGLMNLGSHYYLRRQSTDYGSITTNFAFSKRNEGLTVKREILRFDKNQRPFSVQTSISKYDHSCRLVTTENTINFSAASEKDFLSLEALALLQDLPSLDIYSSPLLNKNKLTVLDMSTSTEFNFSLRRQTSIKVKNQIFETVEIKLQQVPLSLLSFRSKSDEKYKLIYYGGAVNRKIEWMQKDLWKKDPLAQDVEILGISDQNVLEQKLDVKLSGNGTVPTFFNSEKYMYLDKPVIVGTDWEMKATFSNSLSLPQSVVWNSTILSNDEHYLISNEYIQKDLVRDLANTIRTNLDSKNRIQAAEEITKVVNKIVKYDGVSAPTPRTKEILETGRGICYHFSILFASIARELGIPTRIIGGFLIRESGLFAHAWNEIKIDDSTWWPIEPQIIGGVFFQRGYIPTADISDNRNIPGGMSEIENLLQPTNLQNLKGLQRISAEQ